MTELDAFEPDPVVRTALQMLPIPPHGEGFWAELDAALAADTERSGDRSPAMAPASSVFAVVAAPDAGPAPAPVERPAPEVLELGADGTLAVLPPALRRRSNVVLSAVAVAAAVVVVIAGTTLVRQRSGDETAAEGSVTQGARLSSTSTSVAALVAPEAGQRSTEAVLSWVGALGAGDTDAAWAAMGAASQAHFGSRSAFAAEGSALAEGYGAWSAAPPDAVYVTPLRSGDGATMVVTLVGTVDQEGARQRRAEAIAVRMVDGAAQVEPFAFAGALEIVVPAVPPAGDGVPFVPTDESLVIVVPRGIGAPTIRIDDGEALLCGQAEGTELVELADAPGQRCSYQPAGGIEPGDRVLTVAFLSPDGAGITAAAVLFEAA